MQAVTAIVDIAGIAADKRRWNQKCFARCDVCLECRDISHLDSQLGRSSGWA